MNGEYYAIRGQSGRYSAHNQITVAGVVVGYQPGVERVERDPKINVHNGEPHWHQRERERYFDRKVRDERGRHRRGVAYAGEMVFQLRPKGRLPKLISAPVTSFDEELF